MTLALITGGSRGLGRSMALNLAAQGCDVILTYRTRRTEADEVVGAVTALGRRAMPLQLDVTASDSFAAFVGTLREVMQERWQRQDLDVLINNAGSGFHASVSDTTIAAFDELYHAHLKGPFFLTQQLLPLIRDGGRILNVSSGLTRYAVPGYAAYAMMKAGIEVFTRYLAMELGPRRITVNCLAPGAIATDFGGGLVRDDPEVSRMIATQTALGRVGEPDDVGAIAALLAAPAASWVNGQRLEITGGFQL